MIKREAWNRILSLKALVRDYPWDLAGDFNAQLSILDRVSSSMSNQTPCKYFREWVQKSNLIDIGYQGAQFTWDIGDLMQYIDRVLVN